MGELVGVQHAQEKRTPRDIAERIPDLSAGIIFFFSILEMPSARARFLSTRSLVLLLSKSPVAGHIHLPLPCPITTCCDNEIPIAPTIDYLSRRRRLIVNAQIARHLFLTWELLPS